MVKKPSEKEEEHFLRLELERKKEREKEIQGKATEVEKNKAKELHYMKCPKCGMQLIEVDYKGIKVDKCSACQGIWLDAGELEALSQLGKSFLDDLFSLFLKKD
jgi:ribosomal protein L37AE/L43A